MERERITSHPTKFMNDATFIKGFIEEIGRNKETSEATATKGVKPTGNWIYQFRDFADIVSVLKPLVFSGTSAAEAVFRKSLQHELIGLLQATMIKLEHYVINPYDEVKRFRDIAKLSEQHKETGRVSIDGPAWERFSSMCIAMIGNWPKISILRQAKSSEYLMHYDTERDLLAATDELRAITKLVEDYDAFCERDINQVIEPVYTYSPKQIGKQAQVEMSLQEIAILLSAAQRWGNINQLGLALVRTMLTGGFQLPPTLPFSPLMKFEPYDAAKPTEAEILAEANRVRR